MNSLQENKVFEKEIFEFRKKSHRSRFYKVYFFVLRQSFRYWYLNKIISFFIPKTTYLERENLFYDQLAFESKILFLKLGGVYIKLGQFLSNLAHILPPNFIDHLKDLQDRVPAHPFSEIKERFFKDVGKNIDDIFPDIERYPLASASTAQVHRATYRGKKVVIKILYPGIEELVTKDLETVLFVMKWISKYLYSFKYKKIHEEISKIIQNEMNLEEEANASKKMANLFREEKDYQFPKIYDEFTKKSIMVSKFVEGIKITETKINQGKDGKKSRPLYLLLRAYILMIFKFKYFHADPHPGNLIYTPQGKLCFIDFGSVSDLPQTTSSALKKLIQAGISEDYYLVVDSLESLGLIEPNTNKEKIEKISQFALEKLKLFITNTEFFQNISIDQLNPKEAFIFLEGINSSLQELMKVTQIPTNYIMLQRVLGLLVGTTALLDPYRTIFDYSKDTFYEIVGNHKKTIKDLVREEWNDIGISSLKIPIELQKTLIQLNRGRIRIINDETEKQTEKIHFIGIRLIQTLFILGFMHFGNQFYFANLQLASGFFYGICIVVLYDLISSVLKNKSNGLKKP
jgi:ubiquinone biosynthesis protein